MGAAKYFAVDVLMYFPPFPPSCVCSAAMNSETNEEVAIKKVGNAFDNHIDAKRTLREIKLLRHMDHENVCMRVIRFTSNHLWSLDISGVVILWALELALVCSSKIL